MARSITNQTQFNINYEKTFVQYKISVILKYLDQKKKKKSPKDKKKTIQ